MAVNFSSYYTKREFLWSQWKIELINRNGILQFDEDSSDYYLIWFYNGPEVFISKIWKSLVPSDIEIYSNYSQEQNDLDKTDFETNYKLYGNNSLVKFSGNDGVPGFASSKGLGGFFPNPKNNTYAPKADEIVSHYVDAEGALITRGANLTDEGSFRDDFSGNSLDYNLTGSITFTNGSREIIGVGTSFIEELNRDNYIKLESDGLSSWNKILRVPTNTSAFLENPYTGTGASGTAHKTKWLKSFGGNIAGTLNVQNSKINLVSGVGTDGYVKIQKKADYAPLSISFIASINQRINNQTIFFGLRNSLDNPTMYCEVIADGTNNTLLKFRTACNGDEQSTIITLPNGLTTSSDLRYKIDFASDYCSLLINSALVAKHENHIPDMYSDMNVCLGIINSGTVTSTTFSIDSFSLSNHNQIQIANIFDSPISIVTREDQHSIFGKLITSTTASDQIILMYTVPVGKLCYIIGYRIDGDSVLSGSPIKIGRNALASESISPGSLDGNIFRSFMLSAGSTTGDVDLGSNPRKIGVGGDNIVITVTPSGSLTGIWRASMDFVLR